ncbi:MAG: protein-glutamate O-methyltransferase [Azospirillaceae bacterium]
MDEKDFALLQEVLAKRSGLVLTRDKAYLLESRLMPVARRWSFAGLGELVGALRNRRDERLLREVTEAMTTNESSFFRDVRPFDQFRDVVVPRLLENRAGQRRLRIWSAACSSGQEPYSLAMILSEMKPKLTGWQIEILGTDLSTEILAKAKEGVYSQFEVQRGLPIQLLVKHFAQQGDRWHINPDLKAMVQFRAFNLLEDMASLGRFDVIFCRNVLIYFDQPTKARVLDGLSRCLARDGFLYLGGAETVLGLTSRFQPLEGQRGIYRLTDAAAEEAGSSTGTGPGWARAAG